MTAQILHWPKAPAHKAPLAKAGDPEIAGMLGQLGSLLKAYDEELLDTVLARLDAWDAI